MLSEVNYKTEENKCHYKISDLRPQATTNPTLVCSPTDSEYVASECNKLSWGGNRAYIYARWRFYYYIGPAIFLSQYTVFNIQWYTNII